MMNKLMAKRATVLIREYCEKCDHKGILTHPLVLGYKTAKENPGYNLVSWEEYKAIHKIDLEMRITETVPCKYCDGKGYNEREIFIADFLAMFFEMLREESNWLSTLNELIYLGSNINHNGLRSRIEYELSAGFMQFDVNNEDLKDMINLAVQNELERLTS